MRIHIRSFSLVGINQSSTARNGNTKSKHPLAYLVCHNRADRKLLMGAGLGSTAEGHETRDQWDSQKSAMAPTLNF